MKDTIYRDTIYRDDAINTCLNGKCANVYDCADAIKALPSAERKGKWIEEDDYEYGENVWRCSVCGEPYVLIEGTPKQNQYYFCPNCGADLRGE